MIRPRVHTSTADTLCSAEEKKRGDGIGYNDDDNENKHDEDSNDPNDDDDDDDIVRHTRLVDFAMQTF